MIERLPPEDEPEPASIVPERPALTEQAPSEQSQEQPVLASDSQSESLAPQDESVASEPSAQPDSVVTNPAPEPTPEAEPTEIPSPTPAVAAEPQADSYVVQRNDSLWKIVNRMRPGERSEMNRAMIALYRANPKAFFGSINQLRNGAVLQLPSAEEVGAIDQREANREVARQYQEWRGASAAESGEESGRLRLVAPAQPDGAAAAEAEAKAKADAEAKAQSDAKAKAAAEAKARADAEAKRLLELKNAELARAQRERAEKAVAEKAAAEQAAAKAAADKAAAAKQPVPAPSPVQTQKEPTAAAPAPVVAAKQPAEPSLMQQAKEFYEAWQIYILAGLGVLVLLVLLIVRSRRSSGPTPMMGTFPGMDNVPTMTPADFRDALQEDDDAESPVRAESDIEAASFEIPRSGAGPRATAPDGGAPQKSEHQDALAEADFHMAYGLYDQAADIVKTALNREPARRDLKLKLLEIYFVSGNREQFVELAGELHAKRGEAAPGEWDKIAIMGKQIAPDSAIFAGATGGGGDALDVNLEGGENRVDFDLFSTPAADINEPAASLDFDVASAGERAKSSSSDVDFLLDDDQASSTAAPLSGGRDNNAETMRERALQPSQFGRGESMADRTSELNLDDLGLDVGSVGNDEAAETRISTPRFATGGNDANTVYLEQVDDDGQGGNRADSTAMLPAFDGSLDESTDVSRLSSNRADDDGDDPMSMSEVGTKLDLARAYMDMGDPEGARSILEEVMQEGSSGQRAEAQRLLESIQ